MNDVSRWRVVVGCFIGMSVAIPAILIVPLGIYMKPMTADFGWSRTQFSLVSSLGTLFNALSLPLAGYLLDRFPPRRMIAIGAILGTASYAALSLVNSYISFVALLAFAVLTGNLASYAAFMSLAQRWFDKHLGLALSITSTGFGAGVAVCSYLIAKTVEDYDWRTAFLVVGSTAAVIGLINLAIFVRDNTGPVPRPERHDVRAPADRIKQTLSGALRAKDFWIYSGAFALVLFALFGCSVHLPALLSDKGASATQIAEVVAAGSVGALLGRAGTGVLLDRFSPLTVAAIFFVSQAFGFYLLLEGLEGALAAGLLLGAVQGAEIDIMGYVISRRFGRSAYSRILSACFALSLTGAMIGPIVMAHIFDRTGSYDLGLMLLPFAPVIAAGLLFLTDTPARARTDPSSRIDPDDVKQSFHG